MRGRKKAMVVAAQPEATEAGAEMLRAGGNAVDAAVACALAAGVVDPLMCGIAGFGSCGVYLPASGFHGYLDFHAPAPRATRSDMWAYLIEGEARDGFGFLLRGQVNEVGYQAISTPASLAGYHTVHREHGRLPWPQVVEPAIHWAEQGWTVRPHVAFWWSEGSRMGRVAARDRLRHTEAARRLYCRDDGSPKQVGDTVRNPDLGRTLRLIARDGARVFYEGEIARAIAEDMRRHGGLVTLEDLAAYRPVRQAPLWGTYRGHRVATNQPPGGGIMLVQMLNVLEQFDLESLEHNSVEYIRVVAEAMKAATADKDRFVGDPAFVTIPVDQLTAKEHGRARAEAIRRGEKASVPRLPEGTPALPPEDTTHVSVIDADGGCVTMTHSLGMPSGVVTEGLGFMYNGCMSVFDPRPGRAGSLAPGKARFSSVCPTLVFGVFGASGASDRMAGSAASADRPCLVLGAPGATQIAMGVLQVILNVLDFDMTAVEAVSAPRFSATSDAIDVSNRIPWGVQRGLEAQGYQVIRDPHTFGFAAVHAIRVHADGLDGGADPGHDGIAIAV